MRFECNHRRLRRRGGVLILLALSRSYDRIQAIQTQVHAAAKEYQTIPDAVQLWSVQRWYHETRGKTLSSMWNLIIRLVNSRPTSRHIPIQCSLHPSPPSFFSSPVHSISGRIRAFPRRAARQSLLRSLFQCYSRNEFQCTAGLLLEMWEVTCNRCLWKIACSNYR